MNSKAFLIFHLSVGVRLALRKTAPVLAVFFSAYFVLKPEFFNELFSFLLDRGSMTPGIICVSISLGAALMASPTVCFGLNGWIRHLPVSGNSTRRMAEIAVYMAQIPILLTLISLPLISIMVYQVTSHSYELIAGLPFLGFATSKASVPSKRPYISKPLTYISCILLVSGQWLFLAGGILLLFFSDLFSGPLMSAKNRSASKMNFKGSVLNTVIIWRAIKFRILIPYFFSLLIMGALSLFLSNNQLPAPLEFKAVIFSGALSIIVFLAIVSNYIVKRRPVWPWARSLPWSARKRIFLDSLFLGFLTVPLIVLLGYFDWNALFPVVSFLPLMSVWASFSIRKGTALKMGAYGNIIYFGFICSLFICLVPILSISLLLISVLVFKYAVESDRNLKVSKWLEFHHLAAGDSLSLNKQ
jgi:hypothetical protein